MQRSAAQAALGTSRDMAVNDFTGNALVQTSPTGKFGVVTYTFDWTNFAQTRGGLSAGDAFVGGMYLARDDTLVIRYPQGYTIASADPVPDQTGDGLTWYGLHSFGPGRPGVTLEGKSFPLLPVGGFLLMIIAIAALVFYRRRMPAPDRIRNRRTGTSRLRPSRRQISKASRRDSTCSPHTTVSSSSRRSSKSSACPSHR